MNLSSCDGQDGIFLQKADGLRCLDGYGYIKLRFVVIIVGCRDDNRTFPVAGKCVLPVGQQQFLVTSAVKLLVPIMDAAHG